MSDNPNGFNHCFKFEYYPLSNSGNSYFPPKFYMVLKHGLSMVLSGYIFATLSIRK